MAAVSRQAKDLAYSRSMNVELAAATVEGVYSDIGERVVEGMVD
jgi:hypothetical protein